MINSFEFIIEIRSARGRQSAIGSNSFEGVRKLLKKAKFSGKGHITIIRTADNSKIFSGSLPEARAWYGIDDAM